MNGRARIHAMFNLDEDAEHELNARLDAYRTEVITKLVGRLRAIPVDCTALTGPAWYGTGWNDCITALEEIAEYQRPDDEDYPGELVMLRSLVRQLRPATRDEDFDRARVRALVQTHALRDVQARTEAREKALAGFFRPGHTYAFGEHRFKCEYLVAHPSHGGVVAWGWFGRAGTGVWRHMSFGRRQYEARAWADATEAGAR